jgi:hypothetical protein
MKTVSGKNKKLGNSVRGLEARLNVLALNELLDQLLECRIHSFVTGFHCNHITTCTPLTQLLGVCTRSVD